ncbi:uncharacterized protein BX664DRAFT_324013 [Halteromyces radiatus]|uniref:uncharacterized protein n=1 Tax=Halteromyces radiatus TaxID=101107 RepID=UPI00221EDACD|nr:uncharacterized protein BX664DRAFT_324013 [Halteromyces radiatus]KAI8096443.1 hypothetical protein BX664DRAFT_324013 [Halteromyces radiatus]
MHFIVEAWRPKPLESKALTISRGIVSTMMGIAFLCYCGYLIQLLVNDKRLLLTSSEQIPDTGYESPDVELCSQRSTFTIAKCTLIDMHWVATDIPGCTPYIIDGNQDDPTTHCKVFTARQHGLQFRNNGSDDTSIQRVDIYWKMDNITAFEQVTLAVPTLALQFYAASFSPWRQSDIAHIPQQQNAIDEAKQGKYRATTIQNFTTNIYFTPNKYRAIPPGDGSSLFGLTGQYVDIETIETNQHNWPLHPSIALTNGEYHGFFTFQLASPTIDVRREQRQHTILAALGMAGGAYGIMVTLFIAIFGTPRISAFGLIHRVDHWCGKSQWTNEKEKHDIDSSDNDHKDITSKLAIDERQRPHSNHSSVELLAISQRNNTHASSLPLTTTTLTLEERMDYLEGMLREYFVNVDYLDGLRHRHMVVKQQSP